MYFKRTGTSEMPTLAVHPTWFDHCMSKTCNDASLAQGLLEIEH
jgi:hypothetical protein